MFDHADIFGQCESLEMYTGLYVTQWPMSQSNLSCPYLSQTNVPCLLQDYAIRPANASDPLLLFDPQHSQLSTPQVFSGIEERESFTLYF